MKKVLLLTVLMLISISVAKAGQQAISVDAYTEGCYLYSLGDTINAVKYFQKAAKAGSKEGLYSLGLCMLNGFGIKTDQKEGLKMIKKAAESGEPDALYFLGTLHETGDLGYTVNNTEALKYYQEASSAGCFDGHVACGNMYLLSADTLMTIVYWTKAVAEAPEFPTEDQKETLALIAYNLGVFYQYGCGTECDLFEASLYYKNSIYYGNNKDAAFQLGLISLDDEEDPDLDNATYYLTLAAEVGNTDAYLSLGHIERLNGNDDQALIYYLAAGQSGNTNGMYCAASLYFEREEYNSSIY